MKPVTRREIADQVAAAFDHLPAFLSDPVAVSDALGRLIGEPDPTD